MASRFVNEVLEDNQNHQEGDTDVYEEQEDYEPSSSGYQYSGASKMPSVQPDAKVKRKRPNKPQTNKKKAKSWDAEVEDSWTQFQQYLNGSEHIDSQVIMEFLNYSWQTKNMAV